MDSLAQQFIKPKTHLTAMLVQRCSSATALPWMQDFVDKAQAEARTPMVSELLRLDYMGSSEFEWGTIPAAIRQTYEASMKTPEKFWYFQVEGLTAWDGRSVYVFCHEDYFDQIATWIRQLAENEYKLNLKELTRFSNHFAAGDEHRERHTKRLEKAVKNWERAVDKGLGTTEEWEKEITRLEGSDKFFGQSIDFWYALDGVGGGFAFCFDEVLLGDFAKALGASVKYMNEQNKK